MTILRCHGVMMMTKKQPANVMMVVDALETFVRRIVDDESTDTRIKLDNVRANLHDALKDLLKELENK